MASHLGNYNAQSALSYAGGVFLLCEFLDTSAFERRWIWRTSRKRKPFNAIKLVFLLAKYSGIITQLLSIAVITRVYDVDGPTISGCSTWIWLHFGAQYVLWTCLEVLLMLRIYALYGQSKFMGAFLILFMMAEMAVAGYFIIGHVVIEAGPALPIPPYFFAIEEGYCIHNVALGLPIQVMYLGFIQLTTHILILALTLARCVPALRVHHTLKRLLHQLIVDGLIGFIVVVAVIFVPIGAYVSGKITLLYSQPISNGLLSVTTCRLIIRLQTMDERQRRPSIELTSAVSSNFEETGTDWGSSYTARPSVTRSEYDRRATDHLK